MSSLPSQHAPDSLVPVLGREQAKCQEAGQTRSSEHLEGGEAGTGLAAERAATLL